MKKIISLISLFISVSVFGQVYDGMPPAASFRFHAQGTTTGTASMLALYKHVFNPTFAVTGGIKYLIPQDITIFESWQSVNFKQKAWLLTMVGIDQHADPNFSIAATLHFAPFQFNSTASNVYNKNEWWGKTKAWQISAGYKYKTYFAIVPGYRFIGNKTAFVNIRLWLQPLNWLQFRYEFETKQVQGNIFLQMNSLFGE